MEPPLDPPPSPPFANDVQGFNMSNGSIITARQSVDCTGVDASSPHPSNKSMDGFPYRRDSRISTKALQQQQSEQPQHFSLHLNDVLMGYRRAQDGQDLSLNFQIDNLSLTLPSGKTILNGVTGRIVPGRVTVIMGPSGAGKSTFMNVLMGKLDRTGGRLMINDREVEMHQYKKVCLF
jgi:ABC-type multidrug transport system fused ATPase/permease subunit